MSNHQSKYKPNTWLMAKPWITGFCAFVLIAAVSFYIINQRYQIQQDEEKDGAVILAEAARERLQQAFQYSLWATQALATIIDNDGIPKDFDSAAAHILANNKFIDGLELVPDGVIRYIYPEKGNRAALGYNVLADTNRNKEAFKAIEKRELFFAGPLELRQGGIGVVGRLPVFIKNKFWGFSAVIIRLPTLLQMANIDTQAHQGYYFQLSKINPNTGNEEFFLPLRHFSGNQYKVSVPVPYGEWKLSVIPVTGYKSLKAVIPIGIFALVLSALGGVFVAFAVKTPAKLRKLVQERTAELEKIAAEAKDGEQRIRDSESKYRTLVEQATDGIFIANFQGNFLVVNPAGRKLSQYTEEDLKHLRIHDLTVPEELQAMPFKMDEIAAGKTATSERKLRRKDGTLVDVEISARIIADNRFLAFVRDISERKKAEKELIKSREDLRKLTNYMEDIREEERLNISREIHDELGQQLTVLKMDISRLGKKAAQHEDILSSEINELLVAINDMVETVRKISSALRPGLLDDIGLVATLDWYAHDFTKKTGIKTKFSTSIADEKFPEKLSVSLFRIVQESLTNVARHSKARNVEVSLVWHNKQLVLTIEDNGNGFDTSGLENHPTLGILGMKERAMMIGGSYNIYSTPGKGTVIEVVISSGSPELIKNAGVL